MQDIHHKMTMRGIKSLDDAELLALVLESKTQAITLLEEYGSLSNIANTPTNRLRMTVLNSHVFVSESVVTEQDGQLIALVHFDSEAIERLKDEFMTKWEITRDEWNQKKDEWSKRPRSEGK